MGNNSYEYALGVTSQFYFCSLPLRLDSYSRCQYRCTYCFANARGGAHRNNSIQTLDVAALDRRLSRVQEGRVQSAVDEFLGRRQPLHLGGMSDPFMPLEGRKEVSLRLLETLGRYRYPTVISTKGTDVSQPRYLEILQQGNFVVQFSISSLDDRLMSDIDFGAPLPSERLEAMRTLSQAGVPVACRMQPVLPTREDDYHALAHACADAGAFHFAVEHLKLSLENWTGSSRLGRLLNLDLKDYFVSRGSTRVGREWILPVETRLPTVLSARSLVRKLGMSFGAADNDLLLLSDSDACCAGVGSLPQFENVFRANYLQAARRGLLTNKIGIKSLAKEWLPERSVRMYINSHSRGDTATTILDYIRRDWNGAPNGNSPASLYGVVDTGKADASGLNIYEFTGPARQMYMDQCERPALFAS